MIPHLRQKRQETLTTTKIEYIYTKGTLVLLSVCMCLESAQFYIISDQSIPAKDVIQLVKCVSFWTKS